VNPHRVEPIERRAYGLQDEGYVCAVRGCTRGAFQRLTKTGLVWVHGPSPHSTRAQHRQAADVLDAILWGERRAG
jgi:hypothetical protein